jgi:hypothetical protein
MTLTKPHSTKMTLLHLHPILKRSTCFVLGREQCRRWRMVEYGGMPNNTPYKHGTVSVTLASPWRGIHSQIGYGCCQKICHVIPLGSARAAIS